MTWYSQAGQDEWVHSIIGDSGFFVDVGAYDGIEHSNTYALEQIGWQGICIEPNLDAFAALQRNRSSICIEYVMSDTAHYETVPFDGVRVIEGGPPRSCMALRAALGNLGAPRVIDYLSIDVEGHELEVLDGMSFNRWQVRLITIEHNLYCDGPVRKNAIHDVLTAAGFDCVEEDVVAPGYGPYEDWFANTALLDSVQLIRLGRWC